MLLKKAALLVCALLLVTAANLKLVYSVSVDGRALEGNWSRRSLENAQRAAYAAAEERGARRLCLRWRRRRGSRFYRRAGTSRS